MKILDDRLAPSPALRRVGNELHLRVRVLTPMRLTLIQELLYFPLARLWRLVLALFLVDCVLYYFRIYTVFSELTFTRQDFVIYMGLPAVFWVIERFGRWPLTRLLVGRTLHIRVSDDCIRIKKRLFYKHYSRTQRMAFAQIVFEQSGTPLYVNARLLVLIIGETRRVKIAEVSDPHHLGRIVNNLNVALTMHAQSGRDVNPVRQRLARLSGAA